MTKKMTEKLVLKMPKTWGFLHFQGGADKWVRRPMFRIIVRSGEGQLAGSGC